MTKEKNSIGLLEKTFGLLAKIALSILTGVGIWGFLFVFPYEFGDFISRFTNGWEVLAAILLPVFPFALVISAAFVARKKGRKELANALVFGMGVVFPLLVTGYMAFAFYYLGLGG